MSIRAINDAWVIETQSTAYVLGLSPSGLLLHLYWGARLPRLEDYPQPEEPGFWAFNGPGHMAREEYPAHGGIKFVEPCLKVRFADGVRDTLLVFESAEIIEGALPELTVRLKDAHYPLTVSLHYRAHLEEDLLERWVTLENQGEALEIERVWSAQWHMPAQEQYFLHHLSGRWLDEFHLQREPLGPGTKIIESRRLTTSHSHSPWFAVERGLATEDQGEVWFGALAWSGNWKLAAEVTEIQQTRVSMGLNDWDFAWRLGPGERFTTPACLAGFTREGFGSASRRFHQYVRGKVIPHGKSVHKVLYNSWEATTFDVDEASQARLAEIAAGMGVELFVMDDGWFHGRNDDHAGLGDWWPDEA
ncbi:MAG: alpha-galactosidase, partial [Anaerolineae bacterium]|nr:alpha-galactosidase [Anaerolineae bacterium]